ncbi:MAG: hypothetical protein E7426_08660 [Ruminococcaceae bacterium]|jgi:alanine dehydrogenase|nr:hypothetical protein [Oscillospiraceae bacterium]
MIIGIPRELKDHETRVGGGLIPRNVATLVSQGHTVYFQKGLMEAAGISDQEYLDAGALRVDTMEEIYEKCDFVNKFKDMTDGDMKMPFKKGQIIMTAFHMAEGTAKPEQVKILADAGVTCISVETSRYPDGTRAMTRPMGEIAGRTAPLLGGQYLQRQYGGSGVSIVPVTGARRARVCILGGGHAGMCAAQTAEGLGAEVVVFDVSIQRLEYLRTVLKNTSLRFMSKDAFAEEVAKADMLINCIYAYPGMAVPIVTREMVRSMRKGSVIVDLEGEGIIETANYTTISDPYFIEEGIVHVGVTNIPAMVPASANESYAAYVFPVVQDIATYGIKEACKRNPVLKSCVIMVNGQVTQHEVASSQHREYIPLDPDTMF